MRAPSRFVVVAFVLAALSAASPVSSGAQTAPVDESGSSRPGTWRGTGGALGVRAYFNTEPRILPVDDLLTLNLPDATTSWDSSGDANARASSAFPGQTVVGLPDLLATFGVPGADELLPAYPLTVFASPTNPDVATADGAARATIDPELDFIDATASLSVPGLTDAFAPLLEVDPTTASSRQSFEAGSLVARSEAVVGSVRLLGGLITLDGVEVEAVASASASGAPSADSSVTVAGASILGVPVAIRDDGIEVGGMVIPPGGFPDGFRPSGIAGQLSQVVSALGLRIVLLGGEEVVEGQSARASANGVLVELRVPVDGPGLPTLPIDRLPIDLNDVLGDILPLPLPDLDLNVLYRTYVVSVVVGEARAEAFGGEGFGLVSGVTPPSNAPSATAASEVATPRPASSGGSSASTGTASGEPARTAAPTVPVASTAPELRLLADDLAFVFGLLALFGIGSVAAARTSTSVLRTPNRLHPLGRRRAQ